MEPRDNILADFPLEVFTILVFCDACGHQAALDRVRAPPGIAIQELRKRLRCSVCGSHETQIRIVYAGAGEFHYRTAEPAGTG